MEAHTAGIVDEVCPPEQLREVTLAAAGRLAGTEGLDRRTLTALKHDFYNMGCRLCQNDFPRTKTIFRRSDRNCGDDSFSSRRFLLAEIYFIVDDSFSSRRFLQAKRQRLP